MKDKTNVLVEFQRDEEKDGFEGRRGL